jgi:uncharacterized membrane protein YidH (DUF202 family)
MSEAGDTDVTRRTYLAAERTWLAWWRSGIASATAAVAVGGVVPDLLDESHTLYVSSVRATPGWPWRCSWSGAAGSSRSTRL